MHTAAHTRTHTYTRTQRHANIMMHILEEQNVVSGARILTKSVTEGITDV